MSIFPMDAIAVIPARATATLPLAQEYGWDFNSNDFLLIDGKNIKVYGNEAVKVWAWKVLQTRKNTYVAYSSAYGNALESLIDRGFTTAVRNYELERYLKESLRINPYITGVKDIAISVDGSRTDVSFTATTIYGEVTIRV